MFSPQFVFIKLKTTSMSPCLIYVLFIKIETDGCSPIDALSIFWWNAKIADLYEPIVRNSNPESKSWAWKLTTFFVEQQNRSIWFCPHQLNNFLQDDSLFEITPGPLDVDISLEALLEIPWNQFKDLPETFHAISIN